MKILNLLSFVFLIVLGSSGRVQDTREEAKDIRIVHLEKHVKSLQKDSISHAVLKPVHDTIKVETIHDSVVYKKKIITMPLTMEDSDRIGNIKYPIIQKIKVDSFIDKAKKRSYDIQVKEGVDNDK